MKSKGLGHILNELYGVYDRPEEIDFEALPDKFVVKTTTGGGGQNVIVVILISYTFLGIIMSIYKYKDAYSQHVDIGIRGKIKLGNIEIMKN